MLVGWYYYLLIGAGVVLGIALINHRGMFSLMSLKLNTNAIRNHLSESGNRPTGRLVEICQ